MDFKLTDGDIDLTDGALSFVTGKEADVQALTMLFRTWLGETVYDQRAGVPYLQVIFKQRNPDLNSIRFILQRLALTRPGVLSIALELSLEGRVLTISGEARTVNGEIDFTEQIEQP